MEMDFNLNCRAKLMYMVVLVRKREKSVNDSLVVLRIEVCRCLFCVCVKSGAAFAG